MSKVLVGRVYKLLGGFYYVKTSSGALIECRAKGNMRFREQSPKVGDFVHFDFNLQTNKGYISKIVNRENHLIRPFVANVNRAFIFSPIKDPSFSIELLEKFIFTLISNNISPEIIVTKIDLATEAEVKELEEMLSYFKLINIPTHFIKNEEKDKNIITNINDELIVLTGQTGAGKTTFLNHFGHSEKTQKISKALGRGKHTTRASTIYEIESNLVIDTPGFSSFELQITSAEEFAVLFSEMCQITTRCKFRECLHNSEPKCAIKEQVGITIPQWHYDQYLKQLREIVNHEKKY